MYISVWAVNIQTRLYNHVMTASFHGAARVMQEARNETTTNQEFSGFEFRVIQELREHYANPEANSSEEESDEPLGFGFGLGFCY